MRSGRRLGRRFLRCRLPPFGDRNAAEDEDSGAIMEALASSPVSYTDDVKEGVAAFQQKRTPTYRGE